MNFLFLRPVKDHAAIALTRVLTRVNNRRAKPVGIPVLIRRCMLLLLLIFCANVEAQVSSLLNPTFGYSFLNTTGTYTSLGTGGTVFQSGTTLNTDAVSASIALPFPF